MTCAKRRLGLVQDTSLPDVPQLEVVGVAMVRTDRDSVVLRDDVRVDGQSTLFGMEPGHLDQKN